MNKVNYSLLAALVNEPNANLFDDVIYHVLGYTISSMAEAYTDKEHKYSTTDVQTEIKKEVGIEIPVSIIRNTLISISKKGGDVSITFIGEKKNLFSIKRFWSATRTSYVSGKAQELEDRKKKLESQYQTYLQENGYVMEKTIEDFLRQNMEEALSFMKGENDTYINGEYVHVARFLSYIQRNDPRLYEVVCDIVWGAMIAGLLRDGETKVEQEEVRGGPKKTKYFLDTPIVMAALDLSRESNVSQAKDLIRVIKGSGGDILVHQLTYEEIDSILYSVIEAGAPYKLNDLAEAYARRALGRTDIVLMKERLEILLKEMGISILRLDGDELERAKSSCKETLLRQLAKSRGEGDSYTYREVHDICLWQYVSYYAGGSRDTRKLDAYFITSNQDLIQLTKANLDVSRKDCLIRPDNLILNLWIQGGITSEMKKDLLSEKITKCIVANDVDTSRRVNLVLNQYIKTENSVAEEDAKILYQALANRSPKLIELTDELSKDTDEAEKCAIQSQILTEARAEFNERSTSHDDLLKQQERLLEKVQNLEDKYSTIDRQSREKNEELSRHNELLVSRGKQLETQKKLREELAIVRSRLSDIERARDASIQPWKRWVAPVLRILFVLFALGFVYISGRFIIRFIGEDVLSFLYKVVIYLGNIGLWTVIFVFLMKIIFKRGACKEYVDGLCPISKDEYIEKKRKKWMERNKEQANKYADLMGQKDKLEKEDQDIENKLKSLEGAA